MSELEAVSPGDAAHRTDVVGGLVLTCCAGWTLVAAAGHSSARPEGVLLALLAVAAGYAAGRIAGAVLPSVAPAAAALAVAAVAVAVPGTLSGDALAPPLHYGNADAALLSLGTGAACCAAWSVRRSAARLALLGLAAGLAALTLVVGSAAGFAAAAGGLLVSLAAARMRRRLPLLAVLGLCAVLTVGGTVAVARHATPEGLRRPVVAELSQRRIDLWNDALDEVRGHPLRGVGPDRFAELSPTAQSDRDTVKAHSAPLQQAAEQGLPGMLLLGGAFLWALWALLRSPRPTPVALAAAAALTGLAVQASTDYVLSFPAITAGAGLLLGMATARPLAEEPAADHEQPRRQAVPA